MGGSEESPRGGGLRAAGLVVAAMILIAAFMVAAPYLSAALERGYSVLSGKTTAGPGLTETTGQTSTSGTPAVQCSSVVAVKSLARPDISNGTADIAYPPDYCTLASFALQQINKDRADNGTGPVSLGYNQAAQQHADSMLYYGYLSHFDTQGYKPYMRYTLLGGRGADFENVARVIYSANHYTSTAAVEVGIQDLEHSMVYNDSTCCGNGHRYNILSPLHNVVSIGVAYSGTTLYFDEEFENDYVSLNFTVTYSSSPSPYVTMQGSLVQQVSSPSAIYIAFDGTPSTETPTQLENGPHEYGPGTLIGGILPRDFLGRCGQFTQGTTVCADLWKFASTGVDIEFSLAEFVKNYGPGVYTVYLITGSDTSSAITTISTFVAAGA